MDCCLLLAAGPLPAISAPSYVATQDCTICTATPPTDEATGLGLGDFADGVAGLAAGSTGGDGLAGLLAGGASVEFGDGLGPHGSVTVGPDGVKIMVDKQYEDSPGSIAAILLHEGAHFGRDHPPFDDIPEDQAACNEAEATCDSLFAMQVWAGEWHPPLLGMDCNVIENVIRTYLHFKNLCPSNDCTGGGDAHWVWGC